MTQSPSLKNYKRSTNSWWINTMTTKIMSWAKSFWWKINSENYLWIAKDILKACRVARLFWKKLQILSRCAKLVFEFIHLKEAAVTNETESFVRPRAYALGSSIECNPFAILSSRIHLAWKTWQRRLARQFAWFSTCLLLERLDEPLDLQTKLSNVRSESETISVGQYF